MSRLRLPVALALLAALILAFFAMTPEPGLAEWYDFEWNELGEPPGVATIHAIAYDQAHDVLYAAAGEDGVWRYSGVHASPVWAKIFTQSSPADLNFQSLAYDAQHNILYAGDWAG